MKIALLYTSLIVLIVSGLTTMKLSVQNPEQQIIGTWNEKAWEYEKVNTPKDLVKVKDTFSQVVKDQLGKHLVIHSAEQWKFNRDGTLLLTGNGGNKTVKWKLKGRGHILELEYHDHIIEHYNVTKLTNNQMVLNFDSDIQVKGVAKLTFNK